MAVLRNEVKYSIDNNSIMYLSLVKFSKIL